jgi:hypothetical protein
MHGMKIVEETPYRLRIPAGSDHGRPELHRHERAVAVQAVGLGQVPQRFLGLPLAQLARDAKERPWRFKPLGRKPLVPEGNKTVSILRWLRVGRPKTLHEMAYPLKTSYPAVLAIIDDLRRMGATIVLVKSKRRGRAYKMKGTTLPTAS